MPHVKPTPVRTCGSATEADEGRCCSSTLVRKLRSCLARSIVNLALEPVTPILVTVSILYWACSEGSSAAVIDRL